MRTFVAPLNKQERRYKMIIKKIFEEVVKLQNVMSAKDVEIAQLRTEIVRLTKENETLTTLAASMAVGTVDGLKKALRGVVCLSNTVKVEVAGNLMAQQLNEIHDNNNLFVGVNGD
jgi:regulator of replication initiation timing